jgi:hypothetical protein
MLEFRCPKPRVGKFVSVPPAFRHNQSASGNVPGLELPEAVDALAGDVAKIDVVGYPQCSFAIPSPLC